MALDVNTLFFLTMYVEAMLGLLLLLAWVQNPGTPAMAWWGCAHLLRSLSVALYGMYGAVPDLVSIDLAGAILFVSFGVTWTGARVFGGRSPRLAWMAAGAAGWLAASQFSGFADSTQLRHLLSAAIVAGFSWSAAYEFWRGRNEGLLSRWPGIVLLSAQGALFLLRDPLTALLPRMAKSELATAWLTVLSPEALMFTISIAFVMLAMGKERTELRHKTAAMIDPLTGLANRRSFVEDAEAVLHYQARRAKPVAVLLVDLDHFKSVNDRFGHDVGDRVLRLFGEACSRHLRSSDVIGRLGGEEFAVLLSDAARDDAVLAAERLRAEFEEAARLVDGKPLGTTVSIGVAIAAQPDRTLSALLKEADLALYRAKARGRNRVELAPFEPGAGEMPQPATPAQVPVQA